MILYLGKSWHMGGHNVKVIECVHILLIFGVVCSMS